MVLLLTTSLWDDYWLNSLSLRIQFPRIFNLEDDKLISIKAKLEQSSLQASFHRDPMGGRLSNGKGYWLFFIRCPFHLL